MSRRFHPCLGARTRRAGRTAFRSAAERRLPWRSNIVSTFDSRSPAASSGSVQRTTNRVDDGSSTAPSPSVSSSESPSMSGCPSSTEAYRAFVTNRTRSPGLACFSIEGTWAARSTSPSEENRTTAVARGVIGGSARPVLRDQLVGEAELEEMELLIEPGRRDQLPVRPCLDDAALVENEDAIRALDRGEAVRDHEGGPAGKQRVERFLNEEL